MFGIQTLGEAPSKTKRTHFDWLIKVLLRRHGGDLAEWLLGERPVETVTGARIWPP